MQDLFFNNWEGMIRIVIQTILAYFSMVIFLRITGKRTLSKMNAFDFVVTVAMGSTLATVALSKKLPIAEGALAIFILIGLQYAIAWLSVRSKTIKNLITSRPKLIVYKGEVVNNALKKERISKEDLNLALRKSGQSQLEDVDAIILETTGDITVMPQIHSMKSKTFDEVIKKTGN